MVDFSIDREYGGRLRTDGHVEDIEVLSTGYVNYDADFTFESFGEQVPNSDNLAEHAGANMRSGSTLPGLAFALPLAAACGEAVSDKPTGSVSFTTPAEFYPAPESAKPYPAGFPERIGVSGAVVAMGDRTYDANAKEFLPAACDPDFDYRVSFPTGPVIVSPFRLMRTEVTYAMYAACVRDGGCAPPDGELDATLEGPWDAPSRAGRPAAVSYDVARAFCRTYGGELPTEEQFIRATEGDDGGYSIRPLSKRFVACRLGEIDPACETLYRAASWNNRSLEPTLVDVASPSREWDVGPFGHLDLFANAAEWVRKPPGPCPQLKGVARCTPHPVETCYTPDERLAGQARTQHSAMNLFKSARFPQPGEAIGIATVISPPHDGLTRPYHGFRCAFPAEGP